VQFINNEATSVHGYIRSSTVFTSESGEWKLGGFDVLSSMKEDDAIIYVGLWFFGVNVKLTIHRVMEVSLQTGHVMLLRRSPKEVGSQSNEDRYTL
jgi:hypothetical protein